MATTAPASVPTTRTRSPPRGACGMGTYPVPTSTSSDAARSPSRSRSPSQLIDSFTRAVSRSLSRPRGTTSPSPEAHPSSEAATTTTSEETLLPAPAPAAEAGTTVRPRSRSREPRGAAGFGDFAKSGSRETSLARVREEEAPRGAAGFGASRGRTDNQGEGGTRSGSVSRARAAVGRVWDAVKPQEEVVADERTWGAAGLGNWKAAKERSQSRSRTDATA